jgi:hypothetical protein
MQIYSHLTKQTSVEISQKRQRRSLYIAKGNKSPGGCARNINIPNFIKHTLLNIKAYMVPNTIILGDFKIELLLVDSQTNKNSTKKFQNYIS